MKRFSRPLACLGMAASCSLFFASCSSDPAGAKIGTDSTASHIQPPSPLLDQRPERQMVLASTGGLLVFEGGAELSIPANAFLCEGKPVTDSVAIDFVQYRNTFDIFSSGIPMEYDTLVAEETSYNAGFSLDGLAGGNRMMATGTGKKLMRYTFQSAGMVRIEGSRAGKPLTIAPGKSLGVKMPSAQKGTNYSLYYYDTIKKSWEYKGKERVAALPKRDTSILRKALSRLANRISKPAEASDHLTIPVTVMDVSRFPELEVFDKIAFRVAPKDVEQVRAAQNENWYDMEIVPAADKRSFTLTLMGDSKNTSLQGMPILDGKPYPQAMKEYPAKRQLFDEKKRVQDSIALTLATAQAQALYGDEVTREFAVSNFGIWNCDAPLLVRRQEVQVNIQDEAGKPLSLASFATAYEEYNAVYRPYRQKDLNVWSTKLMNGKHVFYGTGAENQIYFAVMSWNEIETIGNGRMNLKMKKANSPSMVYGQLRQFVKEELTAMEKKKDKAN